MNSVMNQVNTSAWIAKTMGKRENIVETYLRSEVEREFNGITRKWVSPGQDGVPDQILLWSGLNAQLFVEVKTVDGKISSVQQREQKRLRENGALVFTVFGKDGVGNFIRMATTGTMRLAHLMEVYECR